MGAPPAPQYATVSFGIFKFLILHCFRNSLLFLNNILMISSCYGNAITPSSMAESSKHSRSYSTTGMDLNGK
eukprot:4005534-Ditylum_brightwellii.AAC.1